MQLGMIGLGRMGANIVRRVTAGGHECVVYDHDTTAVKALASEDRTTGVYSVAELAEKLSTPRIVWVMVPAGTITQTVVEGLANTLQAGDIVIDGGNSYYRDDLKHSKLLGERYQWRCVGPRARLLPDDRRRREVLCSRRAAVRHHRTRSGRG
jgi:6-phosphogluconate dehydrogenase